MRAPRSKKIVIIALAALLVFMLRSPLTRVLAALARPLSGAGTWVAVHMDHWFAGEDGVRARLFKLEQERSTFLLDAAAYEMLRDENAQLLSLLDYTKRLHAPSVAARIVARESDAQTKRFLIDRGLTDGVRIGAPVVVDRGLYVGKVVDVGAHTATVAELTEAGSVTAVTLLNLTRTIGLAEGRSGSLILIRFIPQDELVEVGRLVVTSGLEEHVPSGLVIGLVNSVRSDPSAPFAEAMVEPAADMRRHHMVSVLLHE